MNRTIALKNSNEYVRKKKKDLANSSGTIIMLIINEPRAVASEGGGAQAPQFLADQLTLSQPHYPHPVLQAPPRIFRPCDGPEFCLQH